MSLSDPPVLMQSAESLLQCPLCGLLHSPRRLSRGQRAQCVRCHTTMAERGWVGPNASLIFAVTGLVLALPAVCLPFVSLQQFGQLRSNHVTVGFTGLWLHEFSALGAWVLFCGVIAPIALLALLVVVLATERRGVWRELNSRLRRVAGTVEYWAMPEVQVLGVMVAFLKLGSIVTIHVGPGLWCYAAMSLCMLAAWRRFSLNPAANRVDAAPREARA